MSDTHARGEAHAVRIEGLVDELIRLIAEASAEAWHRPGPAEASGEGAWSSAQVCGHVVEMLPFWADRATEVAAQPGRTFGRPLDDPGRLAGVTSATPADPHTAITRLQQATAAACRTIRALPDTAWERTGTSTTRGPMTVEKIITDLAIDHLDGHLAQVRTALHLS